MEPQAGNVHVLGIEEPPILTVAEMQARLAEYVAQVGELNNRLNAPQFIGIDYGMWVRNDQVHLPERPLRQRFRLNEEANVGVRRWSSFAVNANPEREPEVDNEMVRIPHLVEPAGGWAGDDADEVWVKITKGESRYLYAAVNALYARFTKNAAVDNGLEQTLLALLMRRLRKTKQPGQFWEPVEQYKRIECACGCGQTLLETNYNAWTLMEDGVVLGTVFLPDNMMLAMRALGDHGEPLEPEIEEGDLPHVQEVEVDQGMRRVHMQPALVTEILRNVLDDEELGRLGI